MYPSLTLKENSQMTATRLILLAMALFVLVFAVRFFLGSRK
jgi:hypothetical protein